MRKLGYIHGDICAENVQVKLNGQIKLSDFSFRSYLVPKKILNQDPNTNDISQLASFIFHILDLKPPHHSPRLLHTPISQRLNNLLMLMLQHDPLMRPTVQNIVNLDFIKVWTGVVDEVE
jgi:serine/threonine protein kinase